MAELAKIMLKQIYGIINIELLLKYQIFTNMGKIINNSNVTY